MKQKLLHSFVLRVCLLVAFFASAVSGAWADTYEQLTSIANIDVSAQYVLGIDGTGFHYEGTSSWGKTGLPSAHTPIYYTLTKASDGNSFTAQATISGTTYYLQIPTSNTFSMATSAGTNTDIIIGTTQVSGTNYAVANKTTTTRHLRINGTSGLRSYAGTTGTMAFFYKVVAEVSSYEITAQSNNNSYGTVSLSGTTITATPAAGYTYADPAYTVSPENSATVEQNGNEFTVTPSANTTVTINFEAIPCYTVTLSDDTENPMTEYSPGVGCTLPSRDALNGYEFAGWSETNVSEETTTAPTIIPVGTYYPTANITLYPVYTKTVAGGGTTHETASVTVSEYATAHSWGSTSSSGQKSITLNSDVTATCNDGTNSGKYYTDWRIYQTETGKVTISTTSGELTSVTFTFTNSNSGTLNYNSSTLTSGTAKSVSGTSAEFTLGNSGSATNGQIRITAISVNYDVTGASTTYYWSAPVAAAVETPVIAVDDNPFMFSTTATITCATDGATIKYSYDNSTWNDYSSALTITETKTIYAKAIKGNDESSVAQVTATKNLATPTVTVSGDLTLDLDGETNVSAGTLTAAVTYNEAAVAGATVTWSSSNTDIATIDASTGVVTIKATGSVTFTATYEGNSDYAEATGTKTVTVVDSNVPGSSAENPYTVAQAIANTPSSGTSANVYIRGIVSSFHNTSIVGDGTNYRYYISDDGTTTDQLLVYKGKKNSTDNFSDAGDLEIGDVVVICGGLTTYSSTKEVASGNYIVSRTTKTTSDLAKTNDISLSMTNPSVTATATDYFTTSSTGAISYEIANEAVATVNAAGVVTPVAAGTTTLTVSQAADATYKAGSVEITVTVAAASLNTTTIAANASGSTTYGTNKEEGYMIDDTYDGTVTAVSGNPAVATVAITQHTAGEGTFTITPVAVGTAVITISAPATATCEAADDVTYTITVTAPAGQTTAVAAPTTLFNETFAGCESTGGNDTEGWSGSIANGTLTDGTSTDNSGWTFANGSAANGCAKFGTGSKKGSATTPAIGTAGTLILSFKAAAWNGGSEGTTLNLSVSEGTIDKSSVTMTKGAFGTFTATITNATAETTITFEAQNTSNNRFFLDDVKVTTEGAELTATLNAFGYATYCSQYPLDFSGATDYSAWQITGISGTTITFAKVTGSVKGGTGLLLKGTAGETVTLTSADSDNTLSGNKLYGTTAPTYVAANTYYGLSGNEFKKVNEGTVPSGKALLPASEVTSGVKSFTFVFEGADGIKTVEQVSAREAAEIFNLAGQRLNKVQRGVNIVNGKKVLVK